jgi:hypothetical protein
MATAARLQSIEADFHRDDCDWPHHCGAWAARLRVAKAAA